MVIENRIGKVLNTKKGFLMDFNKEKIAIAILKAANDVGGLKKNIDPDSIYVRLKDEPEEVIAQALTEDVILCLNMQREFRSPHHPPTLDQLHDVVIDVLKDRGFDSASSSYSIWREGVHARRIGWIKPEEFCGNGRPSESLKAREKWCKSHGVSSTEDLNRKIAEGKFGKLVAADSKRYEGELRLAVERFEQAKQERDVRVMIVSGPSSSGKTTTAKKLCKYLGMRGYQFKLLQVDNYFFSTEEYPRDWFGDMDYELPHSIDLHKFNLDLESLMAGKEIHTPEYDFATGSRRLSEKPFSLGKDEILLLDCLHGLYPPATVAIPAEAKFKVYIENHAALRTKTGERIRFTDIRMVRRMCRDVRERGYSVRYTLEHWATVRKGEFKGILPFARTAHAMVNGSLIYDLPALKYNLLHCCQSPFDEKVLRDYKERGRMDVYKRGWRVKKLFEEIAEPTAEEIKAIPEDNLIREFIGK